MATQETGNRTVEEGTVPAVREGGQWKLELTDAIQRAVRPVAQQTSAYELITRDVRAGAFQDRIVAQVALMNAERRERVEHAK